MRRKLCILLLAGGILVPPDTGLHAAERRTQQKQPTQQDQPAQKAEISSEDHQVIQHMQLLALMELLKDMPLLEGETKTVPEGKK
jgi:hypothetical protein